jgi:restriction system protein
VDVVVTTPTGNRWVVQCKRWRGQVGEPLVRDFFGVVHHERAAHGFLITTGSFTPQARAWAEGKPLSLWDGEELVERMKDEG